jgi:hypothetical protein
MSQDASQRRAYIFKSTNHKEKELGLVGWVVFFGSGGTSLYLYVAKKKKSETKKSSTKERPGKTQ